MTSLVLDLGLRLSRVVVVVVVMKLLEVVVMKVLEVVVVVVMKVLEVVVVVVMKVFEVVVVVVVRRTRLVGSVEYTVNNADVGVTKLLNLSY